MTRQRTSQKSRRKPRILVLEGLRDAASSIRAAGGEAIVASPRSVATVDREIPAGFDGLLLTGGGDVSPELYGQKPHRRVYGVSDVRDYVEWAALEAARETDAAVLGICRGMQLIAIHNGGVLKQHVEGHRNTIHDVVSQDGTLFQQVISAGRVGERTGRFTSLHHQLVTRHGPDFRVGGRCPDGKIEAIESKDGRVLGVQFHPEMDSLWNVQSQLLFRWLVIESAKRAGLAVPPVPRPARRLPVRPVESTNVSGPTPIRRSPRRPVASTWFCRDCGTQFDKQQDRDDHEYWVCGDPIMRTTEPPPGHPDWIDPEPKDKKGAK